MELEVEFMAAAIITIHVKEIALEDYPPAMTVNICKLGLWRAVHFILSNPPKLWKLSCHPRACGNYQLICKIMGPRDRLEHHQKEIIEDKIQKERNKS